VKAGFERPALITLVQPPGVFLARNLQLPYRGDTVFREEITSEILSIVAAQTERGKSPISLGITGLLLRNIGKVDFLHPCIAYPANNLGRPGLSVEELLECDPKVEKSAGDFCHQG
jgi:hypothetical protein